jgi:hypothetical protein
MTELAYREILRHLVVVPSTAEAPPAESSRPGGRLSAVRQQVAD